MSAEVCGGRLHLDEAKHGPKKSVQKPLESSLGTRGGNKCRSLNFPATSNLTHFPPRATWSAPAQTYFCRRARKRLVGGTRFCTPNRGFSETLRLRKWSVPGGRRASLSAGPRSRCVYMAARGAGSPCDVIQVKSQPGARERPNGKACGTSLPGMLCKMKTTLDSSLTLMTPSHKSVCKWLGFSRW